MSSGRPARSSSSVRPSTTAARRPCSRPGWTTPSRCTWPGPRAVPRRDRRQAAGDRTTEAAVARAYAIERGVPADRILMEDHGRTTLESLEAVAAILRDHGDHRRRLRVRSDPHAARPADGPRPGHHRLGIADDRPARAWPVRAAPRRRLRPRARRARRCTSLPAAQPAGELSANRARTVTLVSGVSPSWRRQSCPGILRPSYSTGPAPEGAAR